MRTQKQETIKNTKTIFFTGGTSGLGKEAVMQLANAGSKVVTTTRSQSAGQTLITDFKIRFPKALGSIELINCDLASFESVVAACLDFENNFGELDVLINNAGLWNFSFKETKNGVEETLQVNLLAPSLIVHLMLPLLQKSNDAKIINTASGLHQGVFNFEDPEWRNKFSGFHAYRQSKLGVILLTRFWALKYQEIGVGVYCQHPGLVATKLGRTAGWFAKLFFSIFGRSSEKGAETLVFLANTPKDKLTSGAYYKDKAVKKITRESNNLIAAEELNALTKEYLADYI